MGILYCLTGGVFGIGWLIDLFTLGRQVDIANAIEHARYGTVIINRDSSKPSDFAGFSAEKQILMLSREYPRLDVRQVVAATNLDMDEAEDALAKLEARGIARLKIDQEGKASYDFS